ncbi:MAG TPA: hypothetical protein PKA76_19545, partial [Pirellulaceae bacterium]|nr:hypothetical protein [Pirellulaceae bacterium]
MVAEQKRRQPKRRKKYANLDDAWIDENRKTLLVKYARVAELQTQITDRTEAREQQLLSLVD